MNYYERYCGDYARDTGHLSLQEHGAYTVMLDTYYATETPLPADWRALYRICRAMGSKEQEAVRVVADQFFPIGTDGMRRNQRADKVIAKAQKRIAAARANGLATGGASGLPSSHIGTTARPQTPCTKDQEHVGTAPNGARHPPPDDSPILITLPLREGGEFDVRQSLVAEVESLCPAVDVPTTLKEMKLWLVGNPDRRKTRRGIKRFITHWLRSEQDKHGR